jgi:DNA-binding CsgD family transcriptional regulator
MYTDGKKVNEIANEMNVTGQTIYNILNAHGISLHNPNYIGTNPEGCVFRKARKEKMLKLRSEGMSNREIAVHMQCAKGTVVKAIGHQPAEMTLANRKMGYEIRKLKNKTREDVVNAVNNQPEPEVETMEATAELVIPAVSDELVIAVAEKLFTRVINALKGIA